MSSHSNHLLNPVGPKANRPTRWSPPQFLPRAVSGRDGANVTDLEDNNFTAAPPSYLTIPENANGPDDPLADARRRFLAQHGPGAGVRRRAVVPKQVRRALLAAEMENWEGL